MYTVSKDPPKKHLLSTQINLSKFSAAQFEPATEEEKRQQDAVKLLHLLTPIFCIILNRASFVKSNSFQVGYIMLR